MRALPSGHVAHKLTEFAPSGREALTPEQTELFQVRTDVFRPVTLPGELKPRSCKQCAGSSSGFVYKVRESVTSFTSSAAESSPVPFVGQELMIQGIGLLPARTPPIWHTMSLSPPLLPPASLPPPIPSHPTPRPPSPSPSRSRSRSRWTRGNKPPQESLKRSAQHVPELLVHRANQWASMDVCDKKRGGCGAVMNYFHSAASIAHREAKAKTKGRREDITTISQRATRIVEGASTLDSDCPRCDRELYFFNTASDRSCAAVDGDLAGTPCTLIKACQNGAVVPGGSRSTNRT